MFGVLEVFSALAPAEYTLGTQTDGEAKKVAHGSFPAFLAIFIYFIVGAILGFFW